MKFKKLISGISALAVAASAFAGLAVTANAATSSQKVDLSKFDKQATYDSGTDTASLALASKAWSKLDLTPYTQSEAGHVKSVTITYKETVPSGGRTAIGIYDKDGAVYATNAYQDTAGSYVCYGVMGGNNDKRVYLNGNGAKNNGGFAVDSEEEVSLTFDMDAKKFSGKIGAHNVGETAFGSLDSVDVFAVYSWSACTYKISDMNISVDIADETYYTVTYDIQGTTKTESVIENGSIKEVPDTYIGGYTFKGWTKDDDTTVYSTDEIKAMAITADTKFTAQYDVDAAYVEAIKSVSITGADKMTFGPDPDTAESNPYTVVITGVDGTTITEENLSSNVTDFKVTWDIGGFATENDQPGQYCDSYGAFSVNNEGKVATSFELRNVPMNFIGKMTATVTYNGDTFVAEKAVAALGNTTIPTSQILPEGGYPSDFRGYSDALIGYNAAVSGNNQSGSDVVTGNFFIAGSDAGRKAELMSEEGNKFFRVTKTAASKSDMFAHSLNVTNSQAIYEQKVRFNSANSVITFTRGYPIWSSSSSYADVIGLTFTGSAINVGSTALTKNDAPASFQSGVWYKVVISVDASAGTAWAKVYSMDGELLGEASNVALTTASAPTYWAFGLANAATGTMDVAGLEAYYPTADESAYTLTASQDTLSIPNGDTADLAAALKTADGYDITGTATWTVLEEDMAEGVIVTPDAADSHKAKVTLSQSASAGEATVQVNIGGYTKTIKLNITSSAESVKFTKSNTSVSIPLNDTPITAEYEAIVVNGEGADLGRDVTLAVYDKNNTSVYTLPDGISFENGVLTVTKAAPAVTFTIRATGKNTDGEDISKSVKVTVHGLSFDFGAGAEEDLAEGYTAVTADTSYTAARGYGIASGSVTAGGTASTEDAKSDYLEGAMTFKADVEKGKNYTVEITYAGEVRTGYINSDLAGYPLETTDNYGTAAAYAELTTKTYTVAVPTDTLDLIISGSGAKIAAVTITKNADKSPNAKPDIHHVGDSTAANSGSWAYYIDHNRNQFPTLEAVATLYNNGAGGRNLCTYYTQGKLGGVLKAIEPGDIVMFGNNGTNGLGSFFEEDVNFYLDAAEAMGAKIIINSYTPHGAKGGYAYVYDSATNTFNGWRQDSGDPITRKVAEERAASDPNYLGFVEIGKNADAAFNAFVSDYAKNSYDSADAAAQAIIACFGDHNHYSDGSIARDLMLNGYGETKGIVEQIVAILSGDTPEPPTPVTYTVTFVADGETVATRTVNAGEKVTDIPDVPEKEYKTGKWVVGDDDFTNETVINADTTVTARYSAIYANLRFVDEAGQTTNVSVGLGTVLTSELIPIVPTKEGFTGKWVIENTDTVVTPGYTVTEGFTANAVYTEIEDPTSEYTITFDAENAVVKVYSNEELTEELEAPYTVKSDGQLYFTVETEPGYELGEVTTDGNSAINETGTFVWTLNNTTADSTISVTSNQATVYYSLGNGTPGRENWTVKIKNWDEEKSLPVAAILATYDENGVLIGINIDSAELAAGENKDFFVSSNNLEDKNKAETSKLMVWDTSTNKPLVKAVEGTK